MRHIHCRRNQEVGHNVAGAKYIDVEVEHGSAERIHCPSSYIYMSQGLSGLFVYQPLRVLAPFTGMILAPTLPTLLKPYQTDCTSQSYRSYLRSIIICHRSRSYSLSSFLVLKFIPLPFRYILKKLIPKFPYISLFCDNIANDTAEHEIHLGPRL